MTIRRYYELSLFVPFAVPLLMAVAGFGFGSAPGPFEPELRSFQFGTALLALPYLGLVCFARSRMRGMGEPEIVKLSLHAPFLFAGAAWIFLLPLLTGGALVQGVSVDAGGLALTVSAVALVAFFVAAGYVALVDGALCLLYRAGPVRRETASGA